MWTCTYDYTILQKCWKRIIDCETVVKMQTKTDKKAFSHYYTFSIWNIWAKYRFFLIYGSFLMSVILLLNCGVAISAKIGWMETLRNVRYPFSWRKWWWWWMRWLYDGENEKENEKAKKWEREWLYRIAKMLPLLLSTFRMDLFFLLFSRTFQFFFNLSN